MYIAVGLQPEAATAKICIDADCRTLSVEAHPGLTGSDQKYALQIADPVRWTSGRTVTVSIVVRNSSGVSVAKLVERRSMTNTPQDACAPCPAFSYTLTSGQLSAA